MTDEHKVRENRLRRMAQRQGYTLFKSRRRDPRAEDYGLYVLRTRARGDRIPGAAGPGRDFAKGRGMTLDQIEAELTG